VKAISNFSGNVERAAVRQSARALFVALSIVAVAGESSIVDRDGQFRRRAEEQFDTALERHIADRSDLEAAWNLGRTAFDLAEFARSKSERERIATRGITACREAVAIDPQSAPAHYYMAMNLGQLAKVRLLKGLAIVAEMERVFLTARKLDPLFDYAGADRALGLLYHRAPGWPISLGNRSKADRHLTEAIRLRPDYPGNRIALAEFLLDTRQTSLFRQEWERIQELIPRVRAKFSGSDWELSWVEWEQRLAGLAPHADADPVRSPDGDDR
jgi:tetratricopeptide (TPR) repeat protein